MLLQRAAAGDVDVLDSLVAKLRNQLVYERRLNAELSDSLLSCQSDLVKSSVESGTLKAWSFVLLLGGFASGVATGLFVFAPSLIASGLLRCL